MPPSHTSSAQARWRVPIGAPSPCDPKSKSERDAALCLRSCQRLLGRSPVLPHSAATAASPLLPQVAYFLRDYGRQDSALMCRALTGWSVTRKTCALGHNRSLGQRRDLKPRAVSYSCKCCGAQAGGKQGTTGKKSWEKREWGPQSISVRRGVSGESEEHPGTARKHQIKETENVDHEQQKTLIPLLWH